MKVFISGSGKVSHDVRREARPVMDWLRDEIGESVNLTLREGDEVIYVERATPARAIRVEQVIGARALLHAVAGERVVCRAHGMRFKRMWSVYHTTNAMIVKLGTANAPRAHGRYLPRWEWSPSSPHDLDSTSV